MTILEKEYPGECNRSKRAQAWKQMMEFQEKRAEWNDQVVWACVDGSNGISAWDFWSLHGFRAPLLRPIMLKILRMRHTAGVVERIVGVHEHIQSNKRQSTMSAVRLSKNCLLYTSPSPRDQRGSRMPSSA